METRYRFFGQHTNVYFFGGDFRLVLRTFEGGDSERLEDCAALATPSAFYFTASANLFIFFLFVLAWEEILVLLGKTRFFPLLNCNICEAFKHVAIRGFR